MSTDTKDRLGYQERNSVRNLERLRREVAMIRDQRDGFQRVILQLQSELLDCKGEVFVVRALEARAEEVAKQIRSLSRQIERREEKIKEEVQMQQKFS